MTGPLDRLKPGSKVGDWTILEAPQVMKSRIRCVSAIRSSLQRATRMGACIPLSNVLPILNV